MVERDPETGADDAAKPPTPFEAFTSGGAWRSLPLKMKLMVLKLWRVEHDVASEPRSEE
jgi:hypothetical protein